MLEAGDKNHNLQLVCENKSDLQKCQQCTIKLFSEKDESDQINLHVKKSKESSEQADNQLMLSFDTDFKLDEIIEFELHRKKKGAKPGISGQLVLKTENFDKVFVSKAISTSENFQSFQLSETGKKKQISEPQISEPQNGNEKEKSSKESSQSLCLYLILILIGLGIAICLGDSSGNGKNYQHNYHEPSDFVSSVQSMEKLFPNQYAMYWKLIKNTGRKHLEKVYSENKEDLTPLSFLVVSFKETENILDCFLEHIGKSYSKKEFLAIDSGNFTSTDARLKLDEAIKENLKGDQKFVIVKNIEKLSFSAAQLFMTYADEHNDVAAYPQSTIFMSAVLPFPSSNDRRVDEERVSDFFNSEVWGEQDTVDSKAALWTRIGDGLIVLKTESKDPCIS